MDSVDAQIHLWQAEALARPWPPGRAQEAQKPYPMSKETVLLQMDLAGEWLGWPLYRRCGLSVSV